MALLDGHAAGRVTGTPWSKTTYDNWRNRAF
jgi:hypothetical protein